MMNVPPTERLYFRNSLVQEFEALVLAVKKVSEDASGATYDITLNETHFVPTAGGQPNDTGSFNDKFKVVDVVEHATEDVSKCHISHIVKVEPSDMEVAAFELTEGKTVKGKIDWERRTDHRQQHSGQHILTAIVHKLVDCNTLSFHMSSETSYIDVQTPTDNYVWDSTLMIEEAVNRAIMSGVPVEVSFVDATKDEEFRNRFGLSGEMVRIVDIVGIDRSACCGTHVSNSTEVGPLFIRKVKPSKKGVLRIEFVAGFRAVKSAGECYLALAKAAGILGRAPLDVPEMCSSVLSKVTALEKEKKDLTKKLVDLASDKLLTGVEKEDEEKKLFVKTSAPQVTPLITSWAQMIIEKYGKPCLVSVMVESEKALILYSSKSLDCRTILKNQFGLPEEAVTTVKGSPFSARLDVSNLSPHHKLSKVLVFPEEGYHYMSVSPL